MSPEGLELLLSMFTALAAGFVIGAEREQGEEATFGGIRTFPMFGLAGAIGMLVGWWALAVMGLALAVLLGISYLRESEQSLGMSTEAAAIITFGLGALCTARELGISTTDRLLLVAAGATVTLALLSVKKPLHRLVRHVSEEDIYATTKLLALSVVVLPLLPNEEMGPWGAFNPFSIGILVVLISAIGFAGYVAIRIFGARRGFGLTGLLGGLASSTAVTLTFSGRAKEQPKLVTACAVAIILASATMFPRVVIEIWAVSAELAFDSLWPFLAAGAVALAAAVLMYLGVARGTSAEDEDTELELENPFSLWSAFKFALLFVAVLFVSRAASNYFADAGVYISAFLAGLADVDAISLSIARLHERGEVDADVALWGIAIASATNSLSKVGIAAVLGGGRLALRVGLPLLAALAAGGVVLFFAG